MQYRQIRETNNELRRERASDAEKMRRLNAQLETYRQEKERCQLRIHALEQQVLHLITYQLKLAIRPKKVKSSTGTETFM